MIHLHRPECGFLSVQLIKIPGTKNAGCDVRRAGGVGLICMSRQLLHLQIGSHWACLSTPLASLLAYGAAEGIHEHSRGAGLSAHWYTFHFLWLLRLIGWLLVTFGGFGLLKVAKMKVEKSIFLFILLIFNKQQETSKGGRIRGACVKMDLDVVGDLGLLKGRCD